MAPCGAKVSVLVAHVKSFCSETMTILLRQHHEKFNHPCDRFML
jgi:hypothetical protein